MSIENTDSAPIDNIDNDDLDAFDDLFHGREVKADEQVAPVEVEEAKGSEEVDNLEPVDDADDTEDEADPVEEPKEEPKRKKQTFQERINQKTEETRLAREEAAREKEARLALEARLVALETGNTPEVKEVKGEPTPDDLDKDGTPKYPLGEFDPQYAKDVIKFSLDEALRAQKEEAKEAARIAEYEKAEKARMEAWTEKLTPAQERYPDFADKAEDLLDAFGGLDEQYGEYLTNVLMEMDHGPDVLYYLSNNLDEADKIVKMGAVGATIALGRIESRFTAGEDEKKTKVSKAPPPPPTNKGSAVSTPEVPDDTDDLDAFAAKLFKKR